MRKRRFTKLQDAMSRRAVAEPEQKIHRPESGSQDEGVRPIRRSPVRPSLVLVSGAMAFVLFGLSVNPKTISAQQARVIPLEDILGLLEAGMPEARILTLIAGACVSQTDPRTTQRELAEAGASPELRRMVAAFDCYSCPDGNGELLVTFEQAGADLTILSGEASGIRRSGAEVKICAPHEEGLLLRVEADRYEPLTREMLFLSDRMIEARIDLGSPRPRPPQRSIPTRPSDPAPHLATLHARRAALEDSERRFRREGIYNAVMLSSIGGIIVGLGIEGDEDRGSEERKLGVQIAIGSLVAGALGLWRGTVNDNKARTARQFACASARPTLLECSRRLEAEARSLEAALERYPRDLRNWRAQSSQIESERDAWEAQLSEWQANLSRLQRFVVVREVMR